MRYCRSTSTQQPDGINYLCERLEGHEGLHQRTTHRSMYGPDTLTWGGPEQQTPKPETRTVEIDAAALQTLIASSRRAHAASPAEAAREEGARRRAREALAKTPS